MTVSDAVIRGSFASTGGGLYISSGLTLERSIVTGNSSTSGGGIQAWDDVTIRDSTIAGNAAQGSHGGGMLHLVLRGGVLRIERSTVSGNSAVQSGGGIYTAADGAMLVNATISGNHAGDSGGGVFRGGVYRSGDGVLHDTGPLLIVNSTVTENHADADADGSGEGGGIASDTDPADPGRDVALRNSILAGNVDDSPVGVRYVIEGSSDCAPGLTAEGRNLIQDVDGCTIAGNAAGVLIGTSAFLGPLQDNGGAAATHALLVGSPAIDAGDPHIPGTGGGACEIRDQRGVMRPQPGGCDLGAYELDMDLCASPATGCKAAAPGKSKLHLERAAGKPPRLQWSWKGAATSVGDLGAPIDGSDYVLCVFDTASGVASRALTGVIPGGPCPDRPCWKPSGNGFRYHNRVATSTGIEILTLEPGGDGKAAIGIKGRGAELALPSLPLTSEPRVLVQLIRPDVGTCWEASYGAPRVNTSEGFAATSD